MSPSALNWSSSAPPSASAAVRTGSCRRSPTNVGSMLHAPVSPTSTCPARATWSTTASRSSDAGSVAREAPVICAVGGTNASATWPGNGLMRRTTNPSSPRAPATSPPRIAGATLSGWPSIVAASSTSAGSPTGASVTARASTIPATIAADDDPSPRSSGIRLVTSRAMSGTGRSNAAQASRNERHTRLSSPFGSSGAPSPRLVTRGEPSTMGTVRAARCTSSASPNASKPAPRFADVAGTCTVWCLTRAPAHGRHGRRRRG